MYLSTASRHPAAASALWNSSRGGWPEFTCTLCTSSFSAVVRLSSARSLVSSACSGASSSSRASDTSSASASCSSSTTTGQETSGQGQDTGSCSEMSRQAHDTGSRTWHLLNCSVECMAVLT
eukprot:543615-Amphidinium_carterae.2